MSTFARNTFGSGPQSDESTGEGVAVPAAAVDGPFSPDVLHAAGAGLAAEAARFAARGWMPGTAGNL